MKVLLLTVGLVLVCGLQALNNNIEDSSKVTGNWFIVELASNVTSKIEEGGGLRLFVKNISEHGGILRGVFFKRENGKCIQFSLTTFKGDDGQMHFEYDGENDFSLQSVDPTYSMYILHNFNNGRMIIWAVLFGRTPDLPDEIKQKFEEMCESFGIRKDQIRDLSNDDRCEELR
ncbi:major urinary protein-like [Trichosurus vulpecula]|uniref:major urinary protein-like n=1 Tax=Trichosurus vulpecula TaxID=9337 RepID=UPI00186B0CF5|nr:major urinary protein-like [Trichosurus vulpecula]